MKKSHNEVQYNLNVSTPIPLKHEKDIANLKINRPNLQIPQQIDNYSNNQHQSKILITENKEDSIKRIKIKKKKRNSGLNLKK